MRTWPLGPALIGVLGATLPLEEVVSLPIVGSAASAAGVGVFVVTVLAVVLHGRLRKPPPTVMLGGAFVAWTFTASLWSVQPSLSALRAWTFAQLWAMVLAVWLLTPRQRDVRVALLGYAVGAGIGAVWVLLNAASGVVFEAGRYSAAGADPNDLAVHLAMGLATIPCLSRDRGWISSVALGLFALLLSIAVVLTASRTGLLAMCAAWLGVSLTLRPRMRVAALVAVAVALPWLVDLPGRLGRLDLNRLFDIGQQIIGRRLSGRVEIWMSGLAAAGERPFLGAGPGTFRFAVARHFGRALDPHNAFLSVLVEGGLIGLGVFCSMLGTAWRSLGHNDRGLRASMILIWIVWFAGALTLSWDYQKITWFLVALSARRISEVSAPEEPQSVTPGPAGDPEPSQVLAGQAS